MNNELNIQNQRCLVEALLLATMNESLIIMHGPPDRDYDTRHFWTVDNKGNVYDPTRPDGDYEKYHLGKKFDVSIPENCKIVCDILRKHPSFFPNSEYYLQILKTYLKGIDESQLQNIIY
jgi:hypothetical protein